MKETGFIDTTVLSRIQRSIFFSLVSSKGVIRSADHEYDICYHNWDPLRYVATGMVVRSGSTISLKLLPLGIFKVLITMMISVLL